MNSKRVWSRTTIVAVNLASTTTKSKEKERKEDEVIKVGGGMGSGGMDTKNCQI